MAEYEKGNGIIDMIKDAVSYIPQIITAAIVTPIAAGSDMIMGNIEERVVRIQRKILRKISIHLVIGFGGMFLIFALFYFMVEFIHWSKAAAYFSIGIVIFVIGLILKIMEER